MITKELLEYIKGEHVRGIPLESIKVVLLENGWATADIEEAFNNLYSPATTPKAVEPAKVFTASSKIEPVIKESDPITKNPEPIFIKPEPMIIKPETNLNPTNPINKVVSPALNPSVVSMETPITKPIEPIVNPITHHDFGSNNLNNGPLGMGDSFNGADFPAKVEVKNNTVNPYILTQPKIVKSKIRSILFSIVLVLVVLGSAFATYAYYNGYFVSLPAISSKAFDKAGMAQSVSYDATFSVDMSGVNSNFLTNALPANVFSSKTFSVSTKGAYDESDSSNFKLNNSLTLNFGMINSVIETKIIEGMLYAEITKIPNLPFLGDLSSYEKKWIAFPIKGDENIAKQLPSPSNLVGVDSSILSKLTPEQKDQFVKITRNAKFIKIIKKLPLETITNGPAYHFTFEPDTEGIKAYLQEVKDYVNSVGKDNSVLSSFDPVSEYDKATTYVKSFTGEAWIGKSDNLPQKLVIKTTDFVNPLKPEDGTVDLSFVVILSDWDKPVEVVAPEESMTFQELMNQFTGQATENAKDSQIKNSIIGFQSELQTYFTKNTKNGVGSYVGFCSSKAFKDASSSIKSISGGEVPSCRTSKDQYVISIKMTNGTYFCVDSKGSIKDVSKIPVNLCE